jgi:hypothetical protein
LAPAMANYVMCFFLLQGEWLYVFLGGLQGYHMIYIYIEEVDDGTQLSFWPWFPGPVLKFHPWKMGEYGKIPYWFVENGVDRGFIQIPWDFTVSSLCDLLEEHLETTREALQRRRQRCLAASGGAATVSHWFLVGKTTGKGPQKSYNML